MPQHNAVHFEISHHRSAIPEHGDPGDPREIHQAIGRGVLDLGDRNGDLESLMGAQCEFTVEAIPELEIMRTVMHAQCERQVELAGIAEVEDKGVCRAPVGIWLLEV